MARIRSIKPEFWTSEQVMECSTNARLLFIGLWNFCDDAGRMVASEKRIKASVFPSDDFTAENVRRMLVELSSNGLILLYVVEGKEYLQVTGWHHQKIDRPQKSKIPDPPDPNSPNGRRTIGDGREGNGEERKGDKPGGGGSPPREAAREAPTRHEAEAAPVAEAAVPPDAVAAAPPSTDREIYDQIERRCRALLPPDWVNDAYAGPIVRLVADGADLEREVVPIIVDVVAGRRTPIRTWSLLANTVAERIGVQRQGRIAQGLAAMPAAPTPPEEMVDLGTFGRWPEPTLRKWVERFRQDCACWSELVLGPPPGQPGCKIPSRLLLEAA